MSMLILIVVVKTNTTTIEYKTNTYFLQRLMNIFVAVLGYRCTYLSYLYVRRGGIIFSYFCIPL